MIYVYAFIKYETRLLKFWYFNRKYFRKTQFLFIVVICLL